MASYVTPEVATRVEEIMFQNFFLTQDPREEFLKNELIRYVPQFSKTSPAEIMAFVEYQRRVYLDGVIPAQGVPVASFNPTFTDSIRNFVFADTKTVRYTRASMKENGFRQQLHNGVKRAEAFTRQFTPYDLRMFPELTETIKRLPVMIGDAELINAKFPHLAGFHRVEMRFPNGSTYWPRRGANGLDEALLKEYFEKKELFVWDKVTLPDMRLMLAFHGMFAIAHPDTWLLSREEQAANMISLCRLPIDYAKVDDILSLLQIFILQRNLECGARVVDRFFPKSKKQLEAYIEKNEKAGLEGTCVVQSVRELTGEPMVAGKSIKVKTYEDIDTIVHGYYLHDKSLGLIESNIKGALVGIYDYALHMYLPVTKVNLDPEGVQIKTDGQRDRLVELRKNLFDASVSNVSTDSCVTSLWDIFLLQGWIKIGFLLTGHEQKDVFIGDPMFKSRLFDRMPRRCDLASAFELFETTKGVFEGKLSAIEQFVVDHHAFFETISELSTSKKTEFRDYFHGAKEVKLLSAKMLKPDVLLDTGVPVIIETKVFGVTWGNSPYPAGFHTWYSNGFCFNNCFANRIRYDKQTTTDYKTVYDIARKNTVRQRRKRILKEIKTKEAL